MVDHAYLGRLLHKRRTTTDAPGGDTVYEAQMGYNAHRWITGLVNRLETSARATQTIAAYTFGHDNHGNPLTQTVTTGLSNFIGDDRVFTVDRLDRLTRTDYLENGQFEATTFDLVGNRESHTDRTGTATGYTLDNPANEYYTIGGTEVQYDATGNLAVDEDGRQYFYDEQNRLIEIQDSGRATLANYTYDALGRRVTATIDGTTTRYYYDSHSVIEERDATDTLVRYHVNGAQYIDERIATYEAAGTLRTPGFTYYLHNDNYSIAGTGSPDGSVIDRLNFSATGDFDDGDPGASSYYHDADADIDLDLADFASFQTCFGQTAPACLDDHDFDTDGLSDGQIDLGDYARFAECFAGPFVTLSQACGRPSLRGAPPASGTFALHGRPVDVLSDGHTLFDIRARYYPAKHGRWLQRDPTGYTDGGNLYEAFRANATRVTDPEGKYTKLASGWSNGDEVFYQRVWPWPFGVQNEFSVGSYQYINGDKLIVYNDRARDPEFIHVLSLEQVEQWAKKTEVSASDYARFVKNNAVRIDRMTGQVAKRSFGEGFAAFLADATEERYSRLEGFVSSLDPLNFLGGPAMMALTGEDIGGEVSVPGRFRVLGAAITTLEVAPGIYGAVRLFAVSRTPALASGRVSRASRIAYDIRTAGLSTDEVSAIREYARRVNAWLEEAGPQTIRSTAGRLRREASAAARAERVRAARAGRPYTGQAGHVPDTAISGMPDPPAGWLDMPGASNPAAGGGLGRRLGQRIDLVTVDGRVP